MPETSEPPRPAAATPAPPPSKPAARPKRAPRLPWTAAELAILARDELSNGQLARLASALGAPRTAAAVKAKRMELGRTRPLTRRCAASKRALDGWPVMRGSAAARDRRFVRLAVREALRLGLVEAPRR